MSSRPHTTQHIPRLAGADFTQQTSDQVTELFYAALRQGIHGLCYSAYEEGQKPGDQLTEDQIRRRLKILRPHTEWIRTFSCTDGNEIIPRVARELGLKTLVGAWLGDDREKNEVEIENLIAIAKEGVVDIAAVGNEVLYRNDLPAEEVLQLLQRVKTALPGIPVGYVDAYYEFTVHPDITAACDVVLANCYPFWEGCPFEHSLVYMKQMYQQAKNAAGDKPVIITETGWPSRGTGIKAAHPGEKSAMGYFINAQQWTKAEDIPIFYFSSFDESWKVGAEGDVGAYWGLWDMNEKPKY